MPIQINNNYVRKFCGTIELAIDNWLKTFGSKNSSKAYRNALMIFYKAYLFMASVDHKRGLSKHA